MKRNALRISSVATVPTMAANQKPMPTRMPMEAVIQIDAAVVSPRTVSPP